MKKKHTPFYHMGSTCQKKILFLISFFSIYCLFHPVILSRCHYWPSKRPPHARRPSVLARLSRRLPCAQMRLIARSLAQRDAVASRRGGIVACTSRPSAAAGLAWQTTYGPTQCALVPRCKTTALFCC